ncbi:hypothetical protein LS68_009180 [Helicobacter sp. MIT 05-5293]|uniref:hypothetical protein n=1 Tax=unclassified Helicobacter TaxID=2593540 RepID=UPI00051D87ED|nr:MULTISPECIES: hypothetical protein [unclassified Helicobacter]TLD79834.1 hypothetical protein LS68_009180 [Helicobacter sp. MIT 05-5293]TLD85453.1 hypothetical protein LS69_009485 [Helicobacter sp. MIT 05-5294]
MNSKDFVEKINFIKKGLFSQFANDELAVQSAQASLNMQELDFKKQELNLAIKKTLIELELTISRERINNLKAGADAISSIIQAESIKRSVIDNAAINKANAYIGFFNVAMNAIANNSASLNDGSALANISEVVLKEIAQIDTKPLSQNYDTMLKEYGELAKIQSLGLGSKQIGIYAPKNIITTSERMIILGMSVYGENESYFLIDDEQITTQDNKALHFHKKNAGIYKVTFKAKNNDNEFVSESIYIEVREEI